MIDELLKDSPKSEVEKLYVKHMLESVTISETFELVLNLNNKRDQNLLKDLQDITLPVVNTVRLNRIDAFNYPEIINKFMKNSVAQEIKKFFIGTHCKLKKEKCQAYIEGIQAVAKKVTDHLYLEEFIMDQET